MRDQVLEYIRERKLLKPGDRVAVAVSGGADSVALLRVLLELRAELGIVLFVAHFNHQLRGEESDADEHFVAELARQMGVPFFAGCDDVQEFARVRKLSLEEAARDLRYHWLHDLAMSERLNAAATGHNLDDQAETVLMKFLRGAGTRGLSAIRPVIVLEHWPVVRPLLETTRAEVERYLRSIRQPWREDHSNSDTRRTRNHIRHELLPLLERDYNPNIRQLLSETAEISLAEEDFWRDYRSKFAFRWSRKEYCLDLQGYVGRSEGFVSSAVAVQRRIVKGFLEFYRIAADFDHVEAVRGCAMGNDSTVNLPGDWQARKHGDWLQLFPPAAIPEKMEFITQWRIVLHVPGECAIPEAGITLRAIPVSAEAAVLEPPGSLIRADRLDSGLLVRNWQPGDRFRPAHTGSEEKLKRLFSEKKIPVEQRPLWPVALASSKIVWVRGFPVAHDFAWVPGSGDALRIEVLPPE